MRRSGRRLSLLDRLLAAGEKRLDETLLEQMLGLPDQAVCARIIDAIAAADPAAALRGEWLSRSSSWGWIPNRSWPASRRSGRRWH